MKYPNAWLPAAVLAAAAAPAMAQQQVTKRATVAADATVEVSNVQGGVTITAWDKNEVELVAELESAKDELDFEASERHVRIEVERPNGKYGRHDEEDDAYLTLRVPARARRIVDTVSAEIGVTGVRGEQTLESVSGEVRTQAFDAPIRANAVSGDITVTGNGGKAVVTTENVSGTSTVTGVRGEYRGEVVSGEINATIAAAERLEVSSVSGEISVQAELTPTARVEMGSVSGTVTLRIKPPVNADFDIESFSGDIENCFGQKARDTSKYTPGSELNFTQGNGGARVEIETLSGEISLCDR
jgi:DUF4097 and DUF4098 domain-containing protein YvlB